MTVHITEISNSFSVTTIWTNLKEYSKSGLTTKEFSLNFKQILKFFPGLPNLGAILEQTMSTTRTINTKVKKSHNF